jgi:hypothetical protein
LEKFLCWRFYSAALCGDTLTEEAGSLADSAEYVPFIATDGRGPCLRL